MARRDDALERLLDLDGFLAEVGGGFWIKIVAQRVPPDVKRPHGIDYSLTLHEPAGGACSELIMPTRCLRGVGLRAAHRQHRITCIAMIRCGPAPPVTPSHCSRISGVRPMPR